MTIIKMDEVHKTYDMGETQVHALRGVTFQVAGGDFACVVGPSGSGKSTLLNLIGCLDKPTKGDVWFLEKFKLNDMTDFEATNVRRHEIGFIFQTFNLLPVLDITENVELPMIMMGISANQRKERSQKIIEAVGLSEYSHHRPDQLSGGQQQRVAIARALVTEPKLILADEPTANLDSTTSQQILDLMQTMNKEHGTTFLFSTHDPQVMKQARTRIYLADGKIDNVQKAS